ncbi:MAG: SDR family NAD(P)-dependent oxidoreductase [Bdellovibrionales bacterium]|nr:SDR family NAD(P)-dependent oxidoreductase [Bdellovibrionales bacterium]
MPSSLEKFIITKRQTVSFTNASLDTNPLHTDKLYASRTNFGSPVAYGISTLFLSLSKWANGREFSITEAKINFRKPVFIEEAYDLQITDNGEGKVVLEIIKGSTLYGKYSIGYVWKNNQTKTNLATNYQRQGQKFPYNINQKFLSELELEFGFKPNQLPTSQLIFLMWTSYYVGMINPGTQALYSQLTFSIEGNEFIEASVTKEDLHDVFKTLTLAVFAPGFSSDISIKALKRPENIEHPIGELKKKSFNFKNEFNGKTILVTGGNRGLGAVFTKMCALSGAHVVALYRSNTENMKQVEKEIAEHSGKITSFQIDLGKNESVESLNFFLKENNLMFDYVFNNAAPVIYPISFDNQKGASFTAEFLKFFNIGLNTLNATLDSMNPHGTFINISTSFVVEPVPEFSHYISAKSAFESLLNSISLEYTQQNFVTYRLPKILTDQTNLAFSKEVVKDPVDMAILLFEDLLNEKMISKTVNLF